MSSMTQLLTFFLAYGGGSSSTPKDASRFLQEPGSCRCFTAFRQVARACYQLQGRRWRQSSRRFLDLGLEMGCKGLTEFAWGEHFLGVQSSRRKNTRRESPCCGGRSEPGLGRELERRLAGGCSCCRGDSGLSIVTVLPPVPPPAPSPFPTPSSSFLVFPSACLG